VNDHRDVGREVRRWVAITGLGWMVIFVCAAQGLPQRHRRNER
jgi:hypothetical protein